MLAPLYLHRLFFSARFKSQSMFTSGHFGGMWKTRKYISGSKVELDLWKWLRVKERSKMETVFTKNVDLNTLDSKLVKQHWAPFFNSLGTIFVAKKDVGKMLNFIFLDTDSSLQTNGSKRFDNSCYLTLTRPSCDSTVNRLWLEVLVTLTRPIWLGHITAILMLFRQLSTLNCVKLTTGLKSTGFFLTTIKLILCY